MKKLTSSIIITSLLLGGCSSVGQNSKQVPEEMPASQYKGQGFQPKAEQSDKCCRQW